MLNKMVAFFLCFLLCTQIAQADFDLDGEGFDAFKITVAQKVQEGASSEEMWDLIQAHFRSIPQMKRFLMRYNDPHLELDHRCQLFYATRHFLRPYTLQPHSYFEGNNRVPMKANS